jgi:predicted membrane protein
VSWVPLTVNEISDSYDHRFGQATLDLTNVDFTGQAVDVHAEISFGKMRIIVPDDVDVVEDTDVSLGDATVFTYDISGAGVERTERNEGSDGPGGGTLRLRLDVRFGHAEVTR